MDSTDSHIVQPKAEGPATAGDRRNSAACAGGERQAIKAWERAILSGRSRAEQLADWIACTAASGPVLLLHVVWFGFWVIANVGCIPGVEPFDRFPFPFLTMTLPARSEAGPRATSKGECVCKAERDGTIQEMDDVGKSQKT